MPQGAHAAALRGHTASVLIAVFFSMLAGASFAAAGVLQQRMAARQQDQRSLSFGLLRALAREPVWLGGIGFAVLSYAFQAVALTFGPLSLVQPIIISELIFALPVAARLRNVRMTGRDWLASAAVVAGLAMALTAADPQQGTPQASALGWIVVLGGVLVLTAAAVGLGRRLGGTWHASSFALAGAVALGSQSAVYASTLELLREDIFGVFLHWQPYVLIALSILGLLLVQSAFQVGPLAASAPVIDGFEPATAVTIGLVLFGETVRTSPTALALMALGAVLVLSGIVGLDTSPTSRRLHKLDRREAAKAEQSEPAAA